MLTTLPTVKCSLARQAISAELDGEAMPVPAAELAEHERGCTDCVRFRALSLELRGVTRAAREAEAPDLAEVVIAARERSAQQDGPARRRTAKVRADWDFVPRLGIALFASAELITTAWTTLADHRYSSVAHSAHESLAVTAGICVGLLFVAFRPRHAASYVPAVAVTTGLLMLTAALDIVDGETTVVDELPHVDLLAALVLLVVLARGPRHRPGPRLLALPRPTSPSPKLRLLSRSRLATRAAIVAILAGLLVLVASPSFAHATVESSDPAPDSLLKVVPAEVTITFDEAVTAVPEALRVFGPDGSRVDSGVLLRPDGDGSKVGADIAGTAKGTYLVSWRVISADSHPVSGAFTFSVGRRSAPPSAATISSNTGLSVLLGAGRAVGYAGSALLLGGALLLGLATGALGSSRSRKRLILVGAGGLVGSAVVGLLAQGAYDAGLGWSAIARPSLVRDVLATTFGHGLLLRIAAALIIVGAIAWLRGRARVGVVVVAGLGVAVSFAMTGHGVSSPLLFASTTVHAIVASLWIGGLVGLVCWVVRSPAEHVGTLQRFSRVAMTCVCALIATGTYQAWRQVGAWGAFTATTYGRELLVKLGLVAVALGAAALSRGWVRRRSDGPPTRLRRSVIVELALGLCVFGVTASLSATEPAAAAYHPTVAVNLTAGPDLVQVSAVPSGDRTMDLHLYLFGKNQRPTNPPEVDATVTLADQVLGPLPITLSKAGPGHLVGSVAVPIKGTWTLTITVRTSAIDEYVVTTALPIR
jgi:copper transport protein